MFKGILIEKDDAGYRAAVKDIDEAQLPEGDVTVRVERSSLNYKDGLAITGNDYRHAARTFTAYNADPASDAARKVSDRRRDPVHPSNHLDALLYKR